MTSEMAVIVFFRKKTYLYFNFERNSLKIDLHIKHSDIRNLFISI